MTSGQWARPARFHSGSKELSISENKEGEEHTQIAEEILHRAAPPVVVGDSCSLHFITRHETKSCDKDHQDCLERRNE